MEPPWKDQLRSHHVISYIHLYKPPCLVHELKARNAHFNGVDLYSLSFIKMSFKKVPLYSLSGLRNEADEHLHEVMQSLGFEESFAVSDIKLVLGYISVGLAGLLYWAEKKYKNDFNNVEYVTMTVNLVMGYFLIQGGLFLYDKLIVEKAKYVGYKKGKKMIVSTWTDDINQTIPHYCIELDYDGYEKTIEKEIGCFFYDDGFLNIEELTSTISKVMDAVDKSK